MKIALVNPPWTFPKKQIGRTELNVSIPLGLLYLAAVIEKWSDSDVEIVDAFTLEKKIYHETDTHHVIGAPFEKIKQKLIQINPDIIGITSPFTSQINNALNIVKICKNDPSLSNKFIVMGGPHATVMPTQLIEEGADVCLIGEAEFTFLELVNNLVSNKPFKTIDGIAFRGGLNPKKIYIKDLDSLPLPAYHKINVERYFALFKKGYNNRFCNTSERTLPLVTSRGCPYNCNFCSIHLHMGREWRAHSSLYIINHLKFLIETYQVKHISFEDDNLTLGVERFEKILDWLLDNNIKIKWDTPNGVRADKLTKSLLIKSKKSGCSILTIGIESGSEIVRKDIINKRLDTKKIIEIAEVCKKINLSLSAFYMIGLPGETKRDIQQTLAFSLDLFKKYNVMPAVSFAAPLLGTKLYAEAKKKGYLKKINPETMLLSSRAEVGCGLIETEEFNRGFLKEQINSYYRELTRLQLRKPKIILKHITNDPKRAIKKAISKFFKK